MIEPKEFRRGNALVAPGFVIHIGAALLALSGVAQLLSPKLIWGVIEISGAVLLWSNYAWTRRTPIIRVTAGEIVVFRHQFMRPRRVRVNDIESLDESRPSLARLRLTGGREIVIPLHWVEWDDRLSFLMFLKTLAGSARV